MNLVAGCHQRAGRFERHHGAVAEAAQQERAARLRFQDKRQAVGGHLLDRRRNWLPTKTVGIDRDDRVIGPEKLHHPPNAQVAADEVPIEEVQGWPIAVGMESQERWRPRACLHGDS